MLRPAALLSLMLIAVPAGLARAQSSDDETIKAINTTATTLAAAFVVKDTDTIKSLTTEDHVAVTPFYDSPKSLNEEFATIADLDYRETAVGDVAVVLLAPDVAMRTVVADLEGSFKGKPLPPRVFATEILVKRNGKWIERFYQATAPQP